VSACRTCAFWVIPERHQYDQILHPVDPDTYEPMDTGFEVRICQHPRLLFCERPLEANGFAVADGSEYMANFYTAEDFGCVKHEERP
jgi:hypothetical protein